MLVVKSMHPVTYNVAVYKKGVSLINIETLLKNLDKEKLSKILSDPKVQEKAKNVDFNKLMEELKNNPDIVNQLKKLF